MCQRRALAAFHTASFLAAAAQRYEANQIYTSINAMMLAINPYADLGLYAPSVVALYGQFGDTGPPPPPHIFGVAAVGTLPSYHPLAARLRRGGGGPPHLRPARRPLALALALALAPSPSPSASPSPGPNPSQEAFKGMLAGGSQSILVAGESGAGTCYLVITLIT